MMDAEVVRVGDGAVRLGEIVQLDPAHRQRLGSIVIARLPAGLRQAQLSRADLQMLARRAVPGLTFAGITHGFVTIRWDAPAEAKAKRCFEAIAPVAAGAFIAIGDAAAVPCDREGETAALRHDRETGAAVAVQSVAPGDYLGEVRLGQRAVVRRGDKLTLKSRAGPVVVERPVVALQSGKPTDRRIFVETSEGEILATDLATENVR